MAFYPSFVNFSTARLWYRIVDVYCFAKPSATQTRDKSFCLMEKTRMNKHFKYHAYGDNPFMWIDKPGIFHWFISCCDFLVN